MIWTLGIYYQQRHQLLRSELMALEHALRLQYVSVTKAVTELLGWKILLQQRRPLRLTVRAVRSKWEMEIIFILIHLYVLQAVAV